MISVDVQCLLQCLLQCLVSVTDRRVGAKTIRPA